MLTTRFEELRISEDKSFDSFYSKLNEVVIGKFNLGEKTEDSMVVRKILWSLSESFRAKVTAIEESKDLDDIKNWLACFRLMNCRCLLKGRANLLLLRP